MCVFRWAAFFNFKRGNWSRLMPSQNSVLEKRMPIFGKRMPLHSHVFENGCPRMPSNGQNGCPELKQLVKNKSPAPKPGHPFSNSWTAKSLNWANESAAGGGPRERELQGCPPVLTAPTTRSSMQGHRRRALEEIAESASDSADLQICG